MHLMSEHLIELIVAQLKTTVATIVLFSYMGSKLVLGGFTRNYIDEFKVMFGFSIYVL